MTERMHQEDLRALMAAKIFRPKQGWEYATHMADILLDQMAANPRVTTPEPYNGLEFDISGLDSNDESGWPSGIDLFSPSGDHAGQRVYVPLERAEKAEAEVARLKDLANRQGDGLTAWANCNNGLRGRLADAEAELDRQKWFLTLETKRCQEAEARLEGIDGAKAEDPPCPGLTPGCPEPFKSQSLATAAWGRQGWNAVATLRVDLADWQCKYRSDMQDAVQNTATAASRERERCFQAAWTWAKEGPCDLLKPEGLRAALGLQA